MEAAKKELNINIVNSSEHRSPLYEGILRLRKNKIAIAGLFMVLFFILVAIFAPLLAPYDPTYPHTMPDNPNKYRALEEPSWTANGSSKFILGTDDIGRDILSRLIYGARVSMAVGFTAVSIALSFGTLLGALAGYYGRKIDEFIMRGMDILLTIPSLLLAIVIVTFLGPSLRNAMIAIGIIYIPRFARIVRGAVIEEKAKDYVQGARAIGAGDGRLIFIHILPNCVAPLIVQGTLAFAEAILEAAALSFLGLGAQPPTPEWGAMLSQGRSLLLRAWWVMTFPGIMILFAVLGFNLFGDGLRDALDPRLRE
jgi:peptide/nickel transport system permease protein/dipeptide transport system permease protein